MQFDHFIRAQDMVYARVVHDLAAGLKRSHWMWFIFPQVEGLGHSEMSQQFALSSVDEAGAYLQHEILGVRLRECTQIVLDVQGRSAEQIFGHVDAMKFRSCMTLFALCPEAGSLFDLAIDKYFGGKKDPKTFSILGLGVDDGL